MGNMIAYIRPSRKVLLIDTLCEKDLLIEAMKYTGITRTIMSSVMVNASAEIKDALYFLHLLLTEKSQNPRIGMQMNTPSIDCR